MPLSTQNFRAIGIKGQGSIFNIIDTTPVTGGTAFTVLTGLKTLTVGTGWTLNVSNLTINEPGSLTIGPLTFNVDGSITYNTNPYVHVTTLPVGATPTNLGVGINSLASVVAGGDQNTAIGNLAMQNNTAGANNVSVGYNSLNACTTGDGNTAAGRNAAAVLTTGDGNTVLGDMSGSSMPVATNNCVLLNNDGATVAVDGEVHLGNTIDQSLVFLHCPLVTDRMTSSSGPAAIPPTSCYHEFTTTGADALTLADGTPGQHIVITMIVDGGNATLTPANFASAPANISFTNVGDACHLMFSATVGWIYLGGTVSIAIP